jgi:hypothetical protein
VDIVQAITSFLAKFVATAKAWPTPSVTEIVALVASIVSLLQAGITLTRRLKNNERLLEVAKTQLRDDIRCRLSSPSLMTPTSLRGLAKGIETALGCSTITDRMIVEALRLVALDVEREFRGAVRMKKLRPINDAIIGIDREAVKLLFIRYYNSAVGEVLPWLGLMMIIFIGQVVIIGVSTSLVARMLFWSLSGLQVLLGLAISIRPDWLIRLTGQGQQHGLGTARHINRRILLIGVAAEQALFFFLPIIALPYALAFVGLFVARQSGALESSSTQVAKACAGVGVILGAYWNLVVFHRMHTYKWRQVKRLDAKYRRLERLLRVAELGYDVDTGNARDQLLQACDELWVLTGHDAYWQRAHEIRNNSPAVES